jgi:biopolymer transport protein ExbD
MIFVFLLIFVIFLTVLSVAIYKDKFKSFLNVQSPQTNSQQSNQTCNPLLTCGNSTSNTYINGSGMCDDSVELALLKYKKDHNCTG